MAGSSSSDDEFFTKYESIGNWADYQEMVDREVEQTRLRNAVNVRAVLDRIPVAHNHIGTNYSSTGGFALHLTAPKKRKEVNPWKKNPGELRKMITGKRVPLGHTIQIHFDEEECEERQEERQEENLITTQEKSTENKMDLFAPQRKVPEWKKREEEEKEMKTIKNPKRVKIERVKPTKKIFVRKDSLVKYLNESSSTSITSAPEPVLEESPSTITTENPYETLYESMETNEKKIQLTSEDVERDEMSVVVSQRQRKRQQQQEQRLALQKRARLEKYLTIFAIFLFGLLLGLIRSSST